MPKPDYEKELAALIAEVYVLREEFLIKLDNLQNEAIAAYKKAHNLPVLAPGREKEILDRVRAESGEELAPYAASLFETLMYLSREYQKTKLDG